MTAIVILPDKYLVLVGIERNYLSYGLLIIVSIALIYYAKFVLVAAVFALVIGANLPYAIAQILNIDSRILMGSLMVIVLLALVNRIMKLPTGLDKPQGFPAKHRSVARKLKMVEFDNSENTGDSISMNKYIYSVSGYSGIGDVDSSKGQR